MKLGALGSTLKHPTLKEFILWGEKDKRENITTDVVVSQEKSQRQRWLSPRHASLSVFLLLRRLAPSALLSPFSPLDIDIPKILTPFLLCAGHA